MALTDDAKAEIREAIRIVREDRFEQFVRTRSTKEPVKDPEKDPVFDPKKDPEKDPITPPPVKDPEKDPEKEPEKARRSAWWGEVFDEE